MKLDAGRIRMTNAKPKARVEMLKSDLRTNKRGRRNKGLTNLRNQFRKGTIAGNTQIGRIVTICKIRIFHDKRAAKNNSIFIFFHDEYPFLS